MVEFKVDLRRLKEESEIIISDEQIDKDGNIVKEPVVIFATGGERIGYIPIMILQSWIMHHIYVPEIKLRKLFPGAYGDVADENKRPEDDYIQSK